MTYGWAILVVLAAIGALAYFGILSPTRFLPDSCNIESGISCVEYQVIDDGTNVDVQLSLTNNVGSDLEWVGVALNSSEDCPSGFNTVALSGGGRPCDSSYTGAMAGAGCYNWSTVRNNRRLNETSLITWRCNDLSGKSKVQADITVQYKKSNELTVRTAKGELKAAIKEV